MKKIMSILLAALMVLSLAACGAPSGETPADEPVDLAAFYESLLQDYGWVPESMMALEGELLEAACPGLQDIPTVQLVAYTPAISALVNEIVLVECENGADVARVAEILRDRIDYQKDGGAWYPESMEGWSRAEVIVHGNYVAMIACAEAQEEIGSKFSGLF